MILQAIEYTFIILIFSFTILMLQLFWQEKIREGKLNVLKYKVKNLRDEIQIWWEKCFLSEDEKQEFEDYKSTNYTNRLYDSHVEELERLKRKFYTNE
jgi:protein regulator of cytokinesis 1